MCSSIDILRWKKNQKDSDDFWHRKLTLKVKFWYCLTAPHYTNSQNSMITFDYSWFLAKNLSNFVSLPWKLHNRYCHSEYPPEGKLVNPASLQWDGIMYEIVMLYTDLLRFLRNIYIVWAKDCNLCIAEKAHILEADTKTSLNNRSEMLTMCRHKAKFLLKNVK